MKSSVPVLIAGGGLVGLSLAVFLAEHGTPALVVEQHPETSRLPRGRGLNLRAMEVLRAAGVEQELRAAPRSVLAGLPEIVRARSLGEPEELRMTRPAPGSFGRLSPTTPLTIDQNVVEPVLRSHAERRGTRIRFRTRLNSFAQDGAGVTATLRDLGTGTEHTVRADYLVAADGHRSPVRQALGIATRGAGGSVHYANIAFEADLSEPLHGRRLALAYLAEPVPGTMLTRLDGPLRWVLMVPYRPEAGEGPEDFTAERRTALIRKATGVPDLRPRLLRADHGGPVPVWELASWTADRYRSGRVLLAGDAAHVMPPAGGLGGNTGIQDAHNLAWKLAAVVRGTAGEELLESYEAERRPVALASGALSLRQQRRRQDGADAAGTAAAQDPLAVALGYRYSSRAVLAEQPGTPPPPPSLSFDGTPGSRAPHLPLLRDGAALSSLDLYRARHVLLCGPRAARWAGAGRSVGLRHPLDVVLLGTDVTDPTARWATAHGVTDSGAVLVRPDGYVAWRALDDRHPGSADPESALGLVLDRLLDRPHELTGTRTGAAPAV
ncbi:FAD-dependent monooxygenase [Streptomyces sp. HD]|uniref:FAD-dependent monooxygenase n=1 Tax=Streptomyces sp. HD TaxID=3020892 RepID=UPI00232FAD7D|nr:FAD-dependent monooxygenase [Streptomyces sp. HD]MDC0772585.1 FAD-dependent monooxygenase [Streptomyces sp. HD]